MKAQDPYSTPASDVSSAEAQENGTSSEPELKWGQWQLKMYAVGLLLPAIFLEATATLPADSALSDIAIVIILLGPMSSFVAVAMSNLSLWKKMLWAILLPVFVLASLIVVWIAGTVLFGRPFLPTD